MEAQLSLGDVTKSVFTPDFSSTYKSLSAGSTLCNMLTTNTIKQSISVDSSNKSEIKESEYKIKEAEKIISKNILFSIYEFNINSKYSTHSSYLGQNIHTYEYTNLTNTDVPSFKKLHLYLDQIEIILNNHKGIVSTKDTASQLYSSLQEFITEIKSSTDNIYSIVMGNKIINVNDDNFIINAEKLFKGETTFKTKKFVGDKASIASYFNSVKNKYLDIANSVAGYNEGLQKAIIKFNKVMGELATEYKTSYSQVALQIEYKKEELRNVLYTFAMKYFNIANILYSIKAECVHEYLNPSYSDYDDILTIKENNSLEEYDDDLFNESTDIFDDDIDISGDDRQVDFSYRTIELEEAFFGYTIKPLLEGPQAGAGNTGTANPPPAPAGNAVVAKPNGGGNTETKDGKTGTGDTVAPADASKKVAGTKDNPASADKESHIDKGGDVQGFGKWLKDLWNKIMNFMKSLIEKISFAVSKSRDKLLDIINDFDSVKKINENLNNSDDDFTFRIYCNGDIKTMATRINTTKILSMSDIYPFNNADDFFSKDAEKKMNDNFKKSIPQDLKTFDKSVSDINFDTMIDEQKFPDKTDLTVALKNYFAGYDENNVKASWNDLKNNTEGKAKNNILASTINIAKIKQLTVNTIISNIKLARIDQLKNQYNNIITNGQNYIDKLCSITLQKSVKAESTRITMEDVLSEYFSDTVKINEDGNDTDRKVDVEEIKKLFNLVKKVSIEYYADPIYKSANFAYQQMCDNYYNIFNSLLSNPLKTGETNKPEENNQEGQSAQNGQNGNPQQPANNNQGNAEGNQGQNTEKNGVPNQNVSGQ